MIKARLLLRGGLLLGCLTLAMHSQAQLGAEDALGNMAVKEGWEVSLFASEEHMRNPTLIDVDAQGRVWITEAVNYRLFNQDLADPAGDRIRVLEDTDGDGVCDKATTFYQDPSLQSPMGIAVLGDRIYVCQSPDLFYLEDTDGDGKADKKTVVLTGFGGVDHDHAIHGVSFGPDGWLYYSNGDRGLDVTDKSGNRVHAGQDAPLNAATVLRSDLNGEHLEWLAHGMRNPYEPAVDAWGNVYISDNDDDGNEQVRINYVFDKGNYGYWPRRKGDRRLDAVHWNEDQPGVIPEMVKTGFGSPTGLMVYEGDLLGDRYRNVLFHADAGPGVIRAYFPKPDGAGFAADMEVVLSCPDDSWFRPIDVCAAPDGSLLVGDWYDPGVGGHRMADTKVGRVYRLAPKGAAWNVPALDLTSDEGLADAFSSPNQARRYLAYKELETRMRDGEVALLQQIYESGDEAAKARAAWLLARNGDAGVQFSLDLAKSDDVNDRVQAVRILSELGDDALKRVSIAQKADPRVRRQMLLELASRNAEQWAWDRVLELARAFDGNDRFYREAIGIAARGRETDMYGALIEHITDAADAQLAIQLHPPQALEDAQAVLTRENADTELKKLALAAIDAVGTEQSGATIVSVATTANDEALRQYALHLLTRDGGDVWREAMNDEAFVERLAADLQKAGQSEAAWAFIEETNHRGFLDTFLAMAKDAEREPAERVRALDRVRAVAPDSGRRGQQVADELNTLAHEAPPLVASAALEAMNAIDSSRERLVALLGEEELPEVLRRKAARLLGSTQSGSLVLLDLAERGELPQDLTLEVTEIAHASPHEDVRMMAEQLLPRATSAEGDALPPLADLLARNGDASKGREVFFAQEGPQCARCHVVNGEGTEVGPNLSAIGEKLGKQGLYESILNPSAAISHEYKVWLVDTTTEGYVSGYIRQERPDGIDLVDSAGNVLTFKSDEIIERRESGVSLMPTGLSGGMTVEDLVNLVAFLETLK